MKAVVLFNLGGPDRLKSVKPFLFNLFYDPAIIRIANPFRYLLAKLISSRREKEAKEIYQYLGGSSPILEQTKKQASALQDYMGDEYKVFVAMRYWKPSVEDVITQLQQGNFEEIILLPLYPQYSTTTTESFFNHWDYCSRKLKLNVPTRRICCYPNDKFFIEAYVQRILQTFTNSEIPQETRFLFSAHGLPEKVILAGDPYQQHVELSVSSILEKLPQINDSVVCYQSRVGPLKWIGPSTEEALKQAGRDKVSVAIVPISFVSEHSETLYELDYLYRNLAQESGVVNFTRVPTVQDHPLYIQALGRMIEKRETNTCGTSLCRIGCVIRQAA